MTDPLDAQERAPTPTDRMWWICGELNAFCGKAERDFVTEQIRQAEQAARKKALAEVANWHIKKAALFAGDEDRTSSIREQLRCCHMVSSDYFSALSEET